MKAFISRFSFVWLSFSGFVLVTGGFTARGEVPFHFNLDCSQLNVVAAVLLILVLIQDRWSKNSKFLSWFFTQIERFSDSHISAHVAPFTIAVIVGLLSLGHGLRHIALATNGYDVTFLHQSLFYAFYPFKCDLCLGGTYLGDHISPTLWVLSPLTLLIHSDFLIFLLEALAIGIGLWILVSRGVLRSRPAVWLSACTVALCHPALRNSLVWDFREDDLGFFFFCLAIAALYQKHCLLYGAALCLALGSKENFAFVSLFLAVPIFYDSTLPLTRHERTRAALITALLSLFWVVCTFQVLIPHFSQGLESSNNIVWRFPGLGSTPSEVLVNLLTRPSVWVRLFAERVFAKTGLTYMLYFLAPVALLVPRGWPWLVVCVPVLAMNLLSSVDAQRSLQFHYDLFALPALFSAAFVGLNAVFAEKKPMATRKLALALGLALCFSGRWPGGAIQDYWPTGDRLGQYLFLHSLPLQSGTLATTLQPMAQVSRARDLRQLFIPATGSAEDETAWAVFVDHQKKDRTGLLNRSALTADQMVLDLREPWQSMAFRNLCQRGWQEHSRFYPWVYIVHSNQGRMGSR